MFSQEFSSLLFDFVSVRSFSRYIRTTKFYYDSLSGVLNSKVSKLSTIDNTEYILRRGQYTSYQRIKRHPKTRLCAPYGYGKTYIGLKWIMDNLKVYDNAIIWCQANVMKVWIDIFDKAGMYCSDPDKSLLLVRASQRKRHFNYIRKGDISNRKLDKTILIASICDIPEIFGCDIFLEDESHSNKDSERRTALFGKCKRYLAMSAQKCTSSIPLVNVTPKVAGAEKRPNIHFHYLPLGPFLNIQDLREKYGKVVISCNQAEMDICENAKGHVYKLKTSYLPVNKFYKDDNGILIMDRGSSVGVTIKAECIICLNSFNMSSENLSQFISRFTRKESRYDNIHYYFTTCNPQKIRLSCCRLVDDFGYSFNILQGTLYDTLFKAIDMDFYKCSLVDLALLVYYQISGSFKYQYWSVHRDESEISEDMARKLTRVSNPFECEV